MTINDSLQYAEIDHHPDMLYELQMWNDIKGDMGYSKDDNNDGLIYGVYWLDDNGEIVDGEWFKTDTERYAEVSKTNEQLKEGI